MAESELTRLQAQVQQLRTEYRKLQRLFLVSIGGVAVLALFIVLGRPTTAVAFSPDEEGVLHVRGLVVEDANKHERVRLGAPLPDPVIHGVRKKRAGAISGLLIMDPNGNERGGFATSDQFSEAFLGLDSEDEQQVLLLANPKGGVNFDLFDSKGNEAQLTVFANGPKLTMTKVKEKVAELPATPHQ